VHPEQLRDVRRPAELRCAAPRVTRRADRAAGGGRDPRRSGGGRG
jgi:hypothetical protein